MEETCLTKAVSYMKLLKGKVINFGKQLKRVQTNIKQASGKHGKKDVFKPLIAKIRSAGGGNASDLQCNGVSDGPGAEKLKNLTAELTACEQTINLTCNHEFPQVNMTKLLKCDDDLQLFVNLTNAAIAADGAEACALWVADDVASASLALTADFAKCDLSTINAEFTAAKKDCVAAFGACRKIEDTVSATISACSPANSKANVLAAITAGVANKEAAAKLSQKVAALAGAGNSARQAENITCMDFAAEVIVAATSISLAPLSVGLQQTLLDLVAMVVSPCTDTEAIELSAAETFFNAKAKSIDTALAAKNEDLEISLGSTVNFDDYAPTTVATSSP